MKLRRIWLVVAAVLALLLIGAWTLHKLNEWPARRYLPGGAVVIYERIQDELFLPDFTYELCARMNAVEFVGWMARLRVPRDRTTAEPFAYGSGSEDACGTHARFERGVGIFTSWCD